MAGSCSNTPNLARQLLAPDTIPNGYYLYIYYHFQTRRSHSFLPEYH